MTEREKIMLAALKEIAAECYVPLGEDQDLYLGWRHKCVERVDIARDTLNQLNEMNND